MPDDPGARRADETCCGSGRGSERERGIDSGCGSGVVVRGSESGSGDEGGSISESGSDSGCEQKYHRNKTII